MSCSSPFTEHLWRLTKLLGIVFGVNAFGIVVLAQVNERLVRRVASRTLLTWGVAAIALAGMSLLVVVIMGIGLVRILPAFFVMVASLGLIVPNATTLDLANIRAAGSAAALLGVLQFAIGVVVAPLVGLGGTMTAIPMVAAIAAFGIGTLVTFIVFCRPARAHGMIM